MSLPAPPVRVSLPAPPIMVSLPAPPLSDVVAGIAGERVGERVAGGVDGGRAGQGQVLDVGAERVADAALDRVGALPGELGDHVAGRVDHVGVVAGTAVIGCRCRRRRRARCCRHCR